FRGMERRPVSLIRPPMNHATDALGILLKRALSLLLYFALMLAALPPENWTV
ncbi:hypothetical protein ACSSVZ_005677, partial [Amorphus sp. MBR-141]